MKAENYLTKEGKEIFDRILNFIEESKIGSDIDSLELSMLANAFDLHRRAAVEINKKPGGYAQITQSNYSQVTAHFTVWKETGMYIKNNSGKFGLNPKAREILKIANLKPEKKKGKMERLAS